jgi:hypothetical protein
MYNTKPLDSLNIVLVHTLTYRVLLLLCVHFALVWRRTLQRRFRERAVCHKG